MNEHGSVCKLCGGATSYYLNRNSFEIVRCDACGFMFALLPGHFDPLTLYNDAYFTEGAGGYGFNDYQALWDRCCGTFYVSRLVRMHGCRTLSFSHNPATQVLYDQVLDRLAA